MHRSDRTKELTGKSRGGGVCFYFNNSWCDERNIHSIKSFCSPDLEFHILLCRPFWLPREFTAIIITAVYIPPHANTDQALKELYWNMSEQETAYPDAAFVVTGDFNKANFITILQNTSPSTRVAIVHRTAATFHSGMPTNPSPAHLLANRITLLFCSCLLIGRNWNEKYPPSGQFDAGRTNRTLYYRTVLISWTVSAPDDTSLAAKSSTWLHRYYLNWTTLDNAITKFNNEMHSADKLSVKSCHFTLLTQFAYFDIVQCFVTIVLLKALYK